MLRNFQEELSEITVDLTFFGRWQQCIEPYNLTTLKPYNLTTHHDYRPSCPQKSFTSFTLIGVMAGHTQLSSNYLTNREECEALIPVYHVVVFWGTAAISIWPCRPLFTLSTQHRT